MNSVKIGRKSNAFMRSGILTQRKAKNTILEGKTGEFLTICIKKVQTEKNFCSNAVLLEKNVL